MNLTLAQIAIVIAAVFLIGFLVHKYLPTSAVARAETAVVAEAAKVESVIEQDGWKLLVKTVSAVSDASAKKAAVASATSELSEHFANVAKLKAAVAALPEA